MYSKLCYFEKKDTQTQTHTHIKITHADTHIQNTHADTYKNTHSYKKKKKEEGKSQELDQE